MRRINNLKTPVGEHWTITTTVDDGERLMGFAINDTGDVTAYIPRPIMIRYDIGPDAEGGGFIAPIRAPAVAAGDHAYPQIQHPLTWDSDQGHSAPPSEDADMTAAAVERLDRFADSAPALTRAIHELTALRDEAMNAREWLQAEWPEED